MVFRTCFSEDDYFSYLPTEEDLEHPWTKSENIFPKMCKKNDIQNTSWDQSNFPNVSIPTIQVSMTSA